jgi:hypothetical protein
MRSNLRRGHSPFIAEHSSIILHPPSSWAGGYSLVSSPPFFSQSSWHSLGYIAGAAGLGVAPEVNADRSQLAAPVSHT